MDNKRLVSGGTNMHTKIFTMDERGCGNAFHKYIISKFRDGDTVFSNIKFQTGPINEAGVNGCHHEDLLLVVLDRLKSFQEGGYFCRENALAITKIEEALHWLDHRTKSRQDRGVEGTSEK